MSRPGEAAYERAVSIWAKPRVLPSLVAHCESVAAERLIAAKRRYDPDDLFSSTVPLPEQGRT